MSVAAARARELCQPPRAGEAYSVPIEGSEKPERTKIYRHWNHTEGLLSSLDPKVTTAHEIFEQIAGEAPDQNCLGHRPYDPVTKTYGSYKWQTYSQVQERRRNLGIGLAMLHEQLGVRERNQGVGLWSKNTPEWQIVDIGCMSQSYYSVSLYDSLGPESTEYIINHSSLHVICASSDLVPKLKDMASRCPTLRIVVSMDTPSQETSSRRDSLTALKESGIITYTLAEVEAMGAANPRPYFAPKPDDIVTINYTSGTTGNPKGVLLTHANHVAAASCMMLMSHFKKGDVFCSFLPLAHIFERATEAGAMWAGAAIGFYHGNMQDLVSDFKELRPTNIINVPRLYSRFGAVIKAATLNAPGLKGTLSRYITSTKLAAVNDPVYPTNKHMLYDYFWGSNVKAMLGLDRCRVMISGSAPIDPDLHQYIRAIFGNHFAQGYGLTESYAIALAQQAGDMSVNNTGAVLPAAELCLESVPELEYYVTDSPAPRGELLIRSKTLFRGYYKNEEETEKAFTNDEDRWFRTGDICTIDKLGRFTIIDRKKNILKLAQGEYVSPERIENIYLSQVKWASQALVHGDSTKASLVAIFGIVPEAFAAFAEKVLGRIVMCETEELLRVGNDPVLQKAAVKELDAVGRENGLHGFERVKAVRFMMEPLSVANELLTPTLKLKRQLAARRYRKEIDAMYAERADA